MSVKPITQAPGGAIGELAKKINEVIAVLEPLTNLKGVGVKITPSLKNVLLEVPDTGGGGDGGMPEGEEGDILYHDGDGWVVLPAPTGVVENFEPTLRHNGTAPYWDVPEGCP